MREYTVQYENCILPRRRRSSHKGDYGRLLLVGGSVGYTGAPVLAAEAALRTGAGLVFVGVPERVYPIVAQKCTCSMPFPLPADLGELEKKAAGCDALLLGPGLGLGEEARQVLELIHGWQERLYPEHGLHFIHASDEWYILAGEELPEEESYDGYLQLENGVGMLRLLLNEFAEALDEEEGDREERRLSLATGLLAAPYLERMAEQLREKFPRTEVMVCSVKNEFFGEQITVSGLITGQDLVKQLSGRDLAERLLLPCNMLRAEEDVFLDDFTVSQVQSALQVPLNIVKSSGQDLLDAILGRTE